MNRQRKQLDLTNGYFGLELLGIVSLLVLPGYLLCKAIRWILTNI